jgi:hypothetical protein
MSDYIHRLLKCCCSLCIVADAQPNWVLTAAAVRHCPPPAFAALSRDNKLQLQDVGYQPQWQRRVSVSAAATKGACQDDQQQYCSWQWLRPRLAAVRQEYQALHDGWSQIAAENEMLRGLLKLKDSMLGGYRSSASTFCSATQACLVMLRCGS